MNSFSAIKILSTSEKLLEMNVSLWERIKCQISYCKNVINSCLLLTTKLFITSSNTQNMWALTRTVMTFFFVMRIVRLSKQNEFQTMFLILLITNFTFTTLEQSSFYRTFEEQRLTSLFIVKTLIIHCLTTDHQVIFTHSFHVKTTVLDCVDFCVQELKEVIQWVWSDQIVNVWSNVVQIDFVKVSHINHDTTIHKNFDIITLLNVESIVMILNMMLINKRDLTKADCNVSCCFFLITQYAQWMTLATFFVDVDEVKKLYQFLIRWTTNCECKC